MRNEFNRKASPAPRRGVAAAGTPFGRKVLLAVACALVACLGAGVALAANEQGGGLSLPANDKQLEAAFEVSVSPDDDVAVHASGKKTTLHAEAKALEDGQQADDLDAGYQWQILVDEEAGLWADVQGQDAAGIDLTLGMVSSALNAKGEAQVRCVATAATGADEAAESVASDPVKVTVKEAEADAEAADGGDGTAESAAPAVLSETEVEEHAAAAAVRNGGAAAYAAGNGIALLNDGGSGVKKTYNVVINYVFENNGIVSDPYTASLAEGSSFSATVTFPTVQGYLPYVGETQQNSMELNYTNISEDVTINVVYKPANVNYAVIHYQQNVDNDQYTIESTETKQGLTGSQVPEVAKTFEGFYSLLYERPAIAADGSTVIEVYYDRYYYLMNFDMDGGYGTEPVYARYGATIGEVTNPTKAGYSFKGWSETEGGAIVDTLPTTMPAESKTYYAIWADAESVNYTIAYWLENADDDGYSYLGSSTGTAEPGSTVSGSDSASADLFPDGKTYYNYNAGRTDTDVTVEHDGTTVVNVYYDRNEYTLKFYYMRSYTQTTTTGSGGNKLGPGGATTTTTTYYQIPTSTDGYSKYQNRTPSNASWTTVNGAVALKSGYTSSTETKNETINNWDTVATYYYLTLTAKYGANLSSVWPNAPFDNNGNYKFVSWGTQYGSGYNSNHDNKNIKGVYSILDEQLIVSSSAEHTMVSYWATAPTMYSYEIYFSLLDGETAERTYNNEGYKKYNTYTVGSTDGPSGQSDLTFPGVTYVGMDYDANATKTDGTVIRFYYTRNARTVTFNNNYGDTNVQDAVYGQSLDSLADENGKYDKYATYPSSLDPDGYAFNGWYLDPDCTQEAGFNITMPDQNLVFYAKWVPVTHTVKFYLTEASESVYKPKEADDEASFTIAHGDSIAEEYVKDHLEKSAVNEAKPNGDYTFVMWYCYENGEKNPFDPTTQIRKDLTLYGEWSSSTLKQYTVQYVLQSDHSVKVADDLEGSGLAGTTKTFDAKGDAELYAAYQEGYFPTVQSQSLLLDIESNSLVITFGYVQKEAVPYTVRYVTEETVDEGTTTYGNIEIGGKTYTKLAADYTNGENRKAVVTETFKPISGYMPDAYQKRLVVTAEGENTLCFYYTKDEAHAYYKITHYTQNTDGTTWTEYASSQAVGDIGTRYTASSMTIPGFTYEETGYVVNGVEATDVTAEGAKLTADGLEINLYYTRNEYPYQVRYLEQGSGSVLHDPKNGTGRYGQVVSESAIDIDGYGKVDPTSAMLNIRIDEGEGAPNLNIITFYYKEQEVVINYMAVGPENATGFGSVSPAAENVKVESGTAQGSTPTAGDGFKFVGWYKDAACTQPVDASWVTDDKIVPQKTDGKNVAATYYAKFEHDVTSLTITKKVANGTTFAAGDTFVFTVTGPGGFSTQVVIHGAGSVTVEGLKVGSAYTVTEDEAWSWRYTGSCGEENGSITLAADADSNVVTFTNAKAKDRWLDFGGWVQNLFKDGEVEQAGGFGYEKTS